MTELLNLLNTIANEYECDVELGNEFAYYDDTNTIVVDVNDNDERFVEFARKNGLNSDVSNFVISFFHEL